jgi:hypothetical protein
MFEVLSVRRTWVHPAGAVIVVTSVPWVKVISASRRFPLAVLEGFAIVRIPVSIPLLVLEDSNLIAAKAGTVSTYRARISPIITSFFMFFHFFPFIKYYGIITVSVLTIPLLNNTNNKEKQGTGARHRRNRTALVMIPAIQKRYPSIPNNDCEGIWDTLAFA